MGSGCRLEEWPSCGACTVDNVWFSLMVDAAATRAGIWSCICYCFQKHGEDSQPKNSIKERAAEVQVACPSSEEIFSSDLCRSFSPRIRDPCCCLPPGPAAWFYLALLY